MTHTFSVVKVGNLKVRRQFARDLIGKTVVIKGIGFDSSAHFESTGEHFKYLPIPEYGIGLFLLDDEAKEVEG